MSITCGSTPLGAVSASAETVVAAESSPTLSLSAALRMPMLAPTAAVPASMTPATAAAVMNAVRLFIVGGFLSTQPPGVDGL